MDDTFYGEVAAAYAVPNLVALIAPISLMAGRIAVRWQTYGKLFWDDVACFVALLSTIVYSAIEIASWHYVVSGGFKGYDRKPISLAGEVATSFFFYIALWAMDMCILLLYRDLFWVSGKFRKFWYTIFGYLALTVVASSGLLLSLFGSQLSQPRELGTSRATLCIYMNTPVSLILLFLPAWVFPGIHLRHSINWGIAWVIIVGTCAYGLALGFSLSSSLAILSGEAVLYTGVCAVSLVAYSPLIMPNKRQNLWPWSRKAHDVGDAEQQVQTAKSHKPKKIARKPTFSSMLSLIRQNSSSHASLDSVEMGDVRSSLESTRPTANGNHEHGQVRVLELRL